MNSSKKIIRFGHSPDPDDAFMFYAFAYEKIDMRGFKVEHVIEDIESLNQRALNAELEVTAVSFHAFTRLSDKYKVMRSGASMGDYYGPILVKRPEFDIKKGIKKIAVPGRLTTAYLLLQIYAKKYKAEGLENFEPVFVPFDKIFDAVKAGDAELGLIIHEGQLTYANEGLALYKDLGKWWSEETKLPLPLGIDVIRRDLGEETMLSFALLFKESIQYALTHRKEALAYAAQFGRGLAEDLNDKFVGMYVNDRTVDLGIEGEAGFKRFLDEAIKLGIVSDKTRLDFV